MMQEPIMAGSVVGRRWANRPGLGLLQALVAILVVAVGIAVAVAFIKLRKAPQKVDQQVPAPLVEVQRLRVADIPMIVGGYGTVQPKVQVDVIPEVQGKIVSIHPQLKSGGFIAAHETIVQIDPRDYELAVEQAQAVVAEAQVRVDMELAEAEVARREWQRLHPGEEPSSELVLREPQIRQTKALLESAKAQLAAAQLRLERTRLSLPFDALIVSESVDLSQYVVTGQPLARAYGVEAFEIQVPLEDDDLAWFDILQRLPHPSEEAKGTPIIAEVKANVAGDNRTWQGYVARTAGQVDAMSRMVPVVVEVPKPFDVSGGKPPLLPGAFVEVLIQGKVLANAVALPRDAVRSGNQAWIVNDGRLHIKPLEIVRADDQYAYVTSGVEDQALLVVSSLDAAVDGMAVRTQLRGTSPDGEPHPGDQETVGDK